MDLSARRGMPGLAYPEEFLRRLAAELSETFAGTFTPETVQRYVLESYASLLRTSKVKAHLASRTTRFTKDRLTALAQAMGAIDRPVPEVLFVCEQNAGRSQMAAVLTEHLSGGTVHVRSAGSMPAHEINPAVIEAMAEIGLDMNQAFPKPLTDDVVQAADVVITMGCGDACPVYPGKQYRDWDLLDPEGQPIEVVRMLRDEITHNVQALLNNLRRDAVTAEATDAAASDTGA
ncbi:arsenate reductase ArsC [Salinibacterium sp. ZJ454]|uniref:arsenate reductase ArsC n=1 Tax=Salinibacterium sp. ZJ454 TaxID=2708339 RepID=UPI00141F44DB|nr:arsenate reductase ArsC [Salinibacterium sp. ZJ454]